MEYEVQLSNYIPMLIDVKDAGLIALAFKAAIDEADAKLFTYCLWISEIEIILDTSRVGKLRIVYDEHFLCKIWATAFNPLGCCAQANIVGRDVAYRRGRRQSGNAKSAHDRVSPCGEARRHEAQYCLTGYQIECDQNVCSLFQKRFRHSGHRTFQ